MLSKELKISCFVAILGLTMVAPSLAADSATWAAVEVNLWPLVASPQEETPAVINISTKRLARRSRRHPLDSFFDFGDRRSGRQSTLRDQSLGSGVIISPSSYVVTNDHVVRQADRIDVGLSDGREFKARVIGRDSDNDIAILKIDPFARNDDTLLGETTITPSDWKVP